MLGDGVIAKGAAIVPGTAVLDGQYDGSLSANTIEIQAQGIVSGTTQAKTISVSGKLNQSIQASDTLSIEPSGVVTGDIAYGKLEVAKGGDLIGNLKQL